MITVATERLIALRKQLALTQAEMAKQMGLSSRAYQAIENGESSCRLIHTLAAERVSLAMAVLRDDIAMAAVDVRAEALDYARMVTGKG